MQATKSLLLKLHYFRLCGPMGGLQRKQYANTIYRYFPSMINIPFRLVGNRSKRMSHQPASAYKTVVFFGTVEPRLSGLVGTTRNSPDNRGSG